MSELIKYGEKEPALEQLCPVSLRCTKSDSPAINGRCTKYHILRICSTSEANPPVPGALADYCETFLVF